MTLFEIDEEIRNAFESAVDPETGELIDEEAYDRLNALEAEKDTKIENIACWIRNLRSDVEELKAQKQIFADRQKKAEAKADSLQRYLEAVLQGEKRSYARVAISYRKSEAVEIAQPDLFVQYCQDNDLDAYLTYKAPEINKAAIKAAIKLGTDVRYAELKTKQNLQIK